MVATLILFDIGSDTSGVILLSRHSTAARRLAELFQQRKIKKTYWYRQILHRDLRFYFCRPQGNYSECSFKIRRFGFIIITLESRKCELQETIKEDVFAL